MKKYCKIILRADDPPEVAKARYYKRLREEEMAEQAKKIPPAKQTDGRGD